MTKQINAGGLLIGGGAPISVQSMTTTKTVDIDETVAQINRLAALGCDIARVAVPDFVSADAIGEIKKYVTLPIIADIHFDYRLAIRAAEAGADKLRLNPGNMRFSHISQNSKSAGQYSTNSDGSISEAGADLPADGLRAVTEICARKGIPIRIGVNSGSLSKKILSKHGRVTAEALYESAIESIKALNRYDFDDICLSVKTSSVPLTISAYRLLSERTGYPLHLGVTEAGPEQMGIIKSSIGIGALLADGIGDTIRVSLTAPPEREVEAGVAILRALGLRPGYDIISCPTCGRCELDIVSLAADVEQRLAALGSDITVAVMGCAVNGPGEASRADYGIAGGASGVGVIFAKGRVIKKAPMNKLVDELFAILTPN